MVGAGALQQEVPAVPRHQAGLAPGISQARVLAVALEPLDAAVSVVEERVRLLAVSNQDELVRVDLQRIVNIRLQNYDEAIFILNLDSINDYKITAEEHEVRSFNCMTIELTVTSAILH